MPDNPAQNGDPVTDILQTVEQDTNAQIANQRLGELSIYTCPECGGALWQVNTPVLIQFRCHVGHILSGQDLLLEQAQAIESSLYRALRLLEDRRNLTQQLAPEARERGQTAFADWLEDQTRVAIEQGERLQQIIDSREAPPSTDAGLEA